MANIITGAVHHLTLTVTDVKRSSEFYTSLLGFQVAMELGPKLILSNGKVLLVLAPPPDEAQKIKGDVFNENRVGLDHLSLAVPSRNDLVNAAQVFDRSKTSHGRCVTWDQTWGFTCWHSAILTISRSNSPLPMDNDQLKFSVKENAP